MVVVAGLLDVYYKACRLNATGGKLNSSLGCQSGKAVLPPAKAHLMAGGQATRSVSRIESVPTYPTDSAEKWMPP